MAAFSLRALVRVGPIVLAFVLATFVGHRLERGDGTGGLVLWIAMVWVVSTATLVVADRAMQSLLPLATLLRLSLVFPDEAPSRFRFALRSGTTKHLERRIEEGRLGTTEGDAAETLLTMLTTLRDHDRLTRGHSERVRAYSMLIAERMDLSATDRDHLQWGALAHDVGKLAVAPEILRKTTRPSEKEWRELREHPEAARLLVEPLRPWLGEWVDAATQHHERFDGLGYPRGLAGEEISMAGRIVAVADAFDTMTSVRSYKPALGLDDAMAELTKSAGTQFDPVVVRAFLAVPLRRVRLVAGMFGWLANLPMIGEVSAVSAGGGAAAGAGTAVVATAAVITGTVVPSFDFLRDDESPVTSGWLAADEEVERRVDDEPVPTTIAVAPSTTAGSEPESAPPPAPTSPSESTTTSTAGDPTTSTSTPVASSTSTSTPVVSSTSTSTPVASSTSTSTSTSSTTTTVASSAPLIVDDSYTVEEGSTRTFRVLANDSDPDGIIDTWSVTVVAAPSHAEIWWVTGNGRIHYEALESDDPGYSSTDSLRYRACDYDGLCGEADVAISIVDD